MAQIVIDSLYKYIIYSFGSPNTTIEYSNVFKGLILKNNLESLKIRPHLNHAHTKWSSLINQISKKLPVSVKLRDSGHRRSVNYSFELSISVNEQSDGLFFHLNPFSNLYGYIFCSYSVEASIPLVTDNNFERVDLSYFPFCKSHLQYVIELELLIKETFLNYKRLDPFFAITPIRRVEFIGENFVETYDNIDLYQSLLCQSPENIF